MGTWSQHLEEDRALVGHPRKDLGRRQRRFRWVEPTKVQQVQLTILVSYAKGTTMSPRARDCATAEHVVKVRTSPQCPSISPGPRMWWLPTRCGLRLSLKPEVD